jgi:hypothetical protein
VIGYDWPGFLIVLLFGFILSSSYLSSFFPKKLQTLIIFAFLVRVLGSLSRHWVIYGFYSGGDAGRYYRFGMTYAEKIWSFDFSFLQPAHWEYGKWWGTQAVMTISGFVLSIIGPTKRGEFLFFSILSLIGLLLFCKSFQRNFPFADLKKYARWILLWPSLWFWTSSVGKDALILLATGLVVFGYTSKRSGLHWTSMALGLLLASIIRPHVAGLLVVAVVIAHWISPKTRWTALHWLQGIVILVVAIFVIRSGFSNLGFADIDIDNVREYVAYVSTQTTQGGSAITAPGFGLLGIPLAFVNVLFRPFPWEVAHPLSAIAALEVFLFWCIVFIRRRRIAIVASHWRTNKLLRLAIPLTFLYVLMLGMAIGNLGIIARQRIHVLPLLFIWLEALPFPRRVQSQSRLPVQRQFDVERAPA